MSRNILLVEPHYKTKFPPLGLMKISSYHKLLGDDVTFVKGMANASTWESWDRIYISTLFTYHWKATVDTINFYKYKVLRGDTSRIYVGGISATLMPEELWKDTGVTNIIQGLLDRPHMLDKDSSLIIDNLIPDYSLFDSTDHQYDLKDSYIAYATRGCPRSCKFCAVNILEPEFNNYINIKSIVKGIKKNYGDKQHLVLLDNNVLYSDSLESIINDICDLGFEYASKLNNRKRKVDFNQGMDARYFSEDKAKLLSKIAIEPLRIAFDSLKLKNSYRKAIRLASKHNIRNLSNYILYNYNDTPDELWERLKFNIELNQELGVKIYSFPMKFIPLTNKDRSYIGLNWSWYFIRSIQRILNVVKGSVMPGKEFFYRAFGNDLSEFNEILYMPESILMYRSRNVGTNEKSWLNAFRKLTNRQRKQLLEILNTNKNQKALMRAYAKEQEKKIKSILEYYIADDDMPLLDCKVSRNLSKVT